ncbi:hypothetical protein OIU76_012925 [Salix suchowensis]|nr:hypothetical protein OIU76_012925 [Salix suchowensis]
MWKRALREATVRQPWSTITKHYLQVSKTNPPPKVNPPPAFSIIKGALDGDGPVLIRTFGNEEIKLSIMRMAYIAPGDGESDENDEDMNQFFLHVDVSKPGQDKSLHFLCGLYTDALGIHSVSLRPKLDGADFLDDTTTYSGPHFVELDERMRDAFHGFIEERGVNENLFNFLQAWLYLKEHRSLKQKLSWIEHSLSVVCMEEVVSGSYPKSFSYAQFDLTSSVFQGMDIKVS